MSIKLDFPFLDSSIFSQTPSPLRRDSFLSSQLTDDAELKKTHSQASSSNDQYASFWKSTPPRIDDPFLPATPNLDGFDEEFPLTPVIPNTPPIDLLMDDLNELFVLTPPGLDFWDGEFPRTPEIPNTPPYSPYYD
jgi:hypothetical protein